MATPLFLPQWPSPSDLSPPSNKMEFPSTRRICHATATTILPAEHLGKLNLKGTSFQYSSTGGLSGILIDAAHWLPPPLGRLPLKQLSRKAEWQRLWNSKGQQLPEGHGSWGGTPWMTGQGPCQLVPRHSTQVRWARQTWRWQPGLAKR